MEVECKSEDESHGIKRALFSGEPLPTRSVEGSENRESKRQDFYTKLLHFPSKYLQDFNFLISQKHVNYFNRVEVLISTISTILCLMSKNQRSFPGFTFVWITMFKVTWEGHREDGTSGGTTSVHLL